MTAYTTIADSEIDPESPGTVTLFTKIRDNPIAITEGASGAPRIQHAALDNSVVNNNNLYSPTAGSTYLIRNIQGDAAQTSDTSYSPVNAHCSYDVTKHIGCICLSAGVITAKVKHRDVTADVSYVRILKDGVLVQEWSTTSGSFQQRSVDITVTAGAVIVFQQRCNAGNPTEWDDLQIFSDTETYMVI